MLPELIELAGGAEGVITIAEVAEAHRVSEPGHGRGKLVLLVG